MNKALFATASIIVSTTLISVGLVGDTDSCGEITGWTTPLTIFLAMSVPAAIAYYAGRSDQRSNHGLRTKLAAMLDAFDAELPSTIGSTFQLATHYYNLVVNAKPVLQAEIEKLSK
jgi:hypothetical protein